MNGAELIRREIDKAVSKLHNIARRGLLTLVGGDYFCQCDAIDGERFDDVELWQQYGSTSRPPVGSEYMLIKVGGRGEGAIIIATQNREHRPADLEPEEYVSHGKKLATGQAQVRHKPDGSVEVKCATGKTIDIGGSSGAQAMLLGETAKGELLTFFNAIKTASSASEIANAAQALLTGDPSLANWLATFGRVK